MKRREEKALGKANLFLREKTCTIQLKGAMPPYDSEKSSR